MEKMFRKILAIVLSLGILATFCAVPMTTSAETPADETYEDYDVIGYSDLKDTGDNFLTPGGIALPANDNIYTYATTSSTNSAIFKVRVTVANDFRFQIHFSSYGGTNNFAYQLVDGNWKHRGSGETVSAGTIKAGDTFDIETARLKVKSGSNAGKYYTYFIVNGTTIFEKYVDADSSNTTGYLDDKIYFNQKAYSTEPCTISPFVEIDYGIYEAYDVIGYSDLKDTGDNFLTPGGIALPANDNIYTYATTSSTNSSIFKVRVTVANDFRFQIHFSSYGGTNNFAYQLVDGNWKHRGSGETVSAGTIKAGDTFDIETARLKVKSGSNAGKYYTYFIVNGTTIFEKYVDADSSNTTSYLDDKIYFNQKAYSTEPCTISPFVEIADETFEAYDEIGYTDLLDGGNPVGSETQLGSRTFTYNKTSASGSAVFKYRWQPTASAESFLSFDTLDDGGWAYMFGVQVIKPTDEYPNGNIDLRPGYDGGKVELPYALETGKSYDIEFARKKVATGPNAGKYYVYFMMDGVLLAEEYVDAGVDADGKYTSNWNNLSCTISNKIYINNWGGEGGHKITYIPVVETYEAYDEIGFNDLFVGDISMSGKTMTSGQNYTYNATSPSYSMIFKYRWIPGGNEMKFTLFLDSSSKYPFCFASKIPNQTGFGATAGENGAWHLVPSNNSFIVQMDEPVVAGEVYDIEFARLKVANGPNAGKYYVYAKVNGEMIKDYYYGGVVDGVYDGVALSNVIKIQAVEGNKFTAVPVIENYEAYDEIGYADLKDADGNALEGQKLMSGATVLTYDRTSPSSSVILKYRWKIGDVAKFQMSFDKTASDAMSYMFGAWLEATDSYPNGRMWLRPAYGPEVHLASALVPGTSHNIEFARLKVASGANEGKYHVYIKIDDVLIAEDYVAADVVDANGNYTTDPAATQLTLSNEIFFAFWGSEGNIITAYRDPNATHEGTVGDFDGNGNIDSTDLVVLKKILLGIENPDEMLEGIADYNADNALNILDFISIMKDMADADDYVKATDLKLGTQEHLLSDSTKTATYIADASATLGASAYRLSKPIHTLYYATSSNGVTVNETNMAEFRAMVEALEAKGITEILYVTDSFILPYGYYNENTTHHKTVPDPETDTENYIAWLTVNSAAFKALAEEFPEIKYFEPYNEPNVGGNRLEKYGIGWNATEEEQAAHAFTTTEKAGIMADLCWYISRAVKAADASNQVTTPSLSVDTNHSHVDGSFLDALYAAIEAGAHPTNRVVADKRVDNYFTIINIHSYVSYSNYTFSYQAQTNVDEWAARINAAYDVVKAHGDGDSRVWLTETGMSTYNSDGSTRDEDKAAKFISLALEKLDSELTFIDTVFIYKLADRSSDMGQTAIETAYGLFYSGDDLDNPYAAKATAQAVYSYFHNGSTDYSALESLVGRYA